MSTCCEQNAVVTHYPSFAIRTHSRHAGLLGVAAAIFGLGFAAGALVRPPLSPTLRPAGTAFGATRSAEPAPLTSTATPRPDAPAAYPAEVVRVIDGDTFEARVRVWPGLDVNTKVRLRNIDAPELHARCADELAKAQAARGALETMLAAGGVTLSRVGLDKYGGRVDAAVSTRDTADVSSALLNGGWARSYAGGHRGSWC